MDRENGTVIQVELKLDGDKMRGAIKSEADDGPVSAPLEVTRNK